MQTYITLLLSEGILRAFLCSIIVDFIYFSWVKFNLASFCDYLRYIGRSRHTGHFFHLLFESFLVAFTKEREQVLISTKDSIPQHVSAEASQQLAALHDVA